MEVWKIEEMVNCKNCVHQKMCIDKISCGVLTTDKDGYLKLKCNYYQPKLPEDSVVLSKKEYDKLKYQWITDSDAYKKGSNETAANILKFFENCLSLYYPNGLIPYGVFQKVIDNLAKQFSVEKE